MGGLLYLLPVSQAMLIHGLAQFVSNGTRAVVWRKYIAFDILARFAFTSVLCLGVFTLVPAWRVLFLCRRLCVYLLRASVAWSRGAV